MSFPFENFSDKEHFKCKIFPNIPENPYEALGLAPGCTSEEVISAYRKLVYMCHSDHSNKEGEEYKREAANWFIAIGEAKDVLINTSKTYAKNQYFKYGSSFGGSGKISPLETFYKAKKDREEREVREKSEKQKRDEEERQARVKEEIRQREEAEAKERAKAQEEFQSHFDPGSVHNEQEQRTESETENSSTENENADEQKNSSGGTESQSENSEKPNESTGEFHISDEMLDYVYAISPKLATKLYFLTSLNEIDREISRASEKGEITDEQLLRILDFLPKHENKDQTEDKTSEQNTENAENPEAKRYEEAVEFLVGLSRSQNRPELEQLVSIIEEISKNADQFESNKKILEKEINADLQKGNLSKEEKNKLFEIFGIEENTYGEEEQAEKLRWKFEGEKRKNILDYIQKIIDDFASHFPSPRLEKDEEIFNMLSNFLRDISNCADLESFQSVMSAYWTNIFQNEREDILRMAGLRLNADGNFEPYEYPDESKKAESDKSGEGDQKKSSHTTSNSYEDSYTGFRVPLRTLEILDEIIARGKNIEIVKKKIKYAGTIEDVKNEISMAFAFKQIDESEMKELFDSLNITEQGADNTNTANTQSEEQNSGNNTPPQTPPTPAGPEAAEAVEDVDAILSQARSDYAEALTKHKKAVREKKGVFKKILSDLGIEKQMPESSKSQEFLDAEKAYIAAKKKKAERMDLFNNTETRRFKKSGDVFEFNQNLIEHAEKEYDILQRKILETLPPKEKGICKKAFEKWSKAPIIARVGALPILIGIVIALAPAGGLAAGATYAGMRLARAGGGIVGARVTGKVADWKSGRTNENLRKDATFDYGMNIEEDNFEAKEKELMEYFAKEENLKKRQRMYKVMAMIAGGGIVGLGVGHAEGSLQNTLTHHGAIPPVPDHTKPIVGDGVKPKAPPPPEAPTAPKAPQAENLSTAAPKAPVQAEAPVQTPDQVKIPPTDINPGVKPETLDQIRSEEHLNFDLNKLAHPTPEIKLPTSTPNDIMNAPKMPGMMKGGFVESSQDNHVAAVNGVPQPVPTEGTAFQEHIPGQMFTPKPFVQMDSEHFNVMENHPATPIAPSVHEAVPHAQDLPGGQSPETLGNDFSHGGPTHAESWNDTLNNPPKLSGNLTQEQAELLSKPYVPTPHPPLTPPLTADAPNFGMHAPGVDLPNNHVLPPEMPVENFPTSAGSGVHSFDLPSGGKTFHVGIVDTTTAGKQVFVDGVKIAEAAPQSAGSSGGVMHLLDKFQDGKVNAPIREAFVRAQEIVTKNSPSLGKTVIPVPFEHGQISIVRGIVEKGVENPNAVNIMLNGKSIAHGLITAKGPQIKIDPGIPKGGLFLADTVYERAFKNVAPLLKTFKITK